MKEKIWSHVILRARMPTRLNKFALLTDQNQYHIENNEFLYSSVLFKKLVKFLVAVKVGKIIFLSGCLLNLLVAIKI